MEGTSTTASPKYAEVADCIDTSNFRSSYSRLEPTSDIAFRHSFHVHVSPAADRVPLYRYYNSEFRDVFLTTGWDELAYGFAGWRYSGILGYVDTQYTSGSTRLYRWFNDDTGSHAYTTLSSPDYLVSTAGWALEGQTIYVPIPSAESGVDSIAAAHRCKFLDCHRLAIRYDLECCLSHLDGYEAGTALDSIVEVENELCKIDLSGLRLHISDLNYISQWIQKIVSESGQWQVDLSRAIVPGDWELNLPRGVAFVDLSFVKVDGDLEIGDGRLQRLALAGSIIGGSLTIRDVEIQSALLADRLVVSSVLRVENITALEAHTYFDATQAMRIEIAGSKFGVLSLAHSQVSIRSLIAGSTIGTLVCTGLTAIGDWALRQCRVLTYAEFRDMNVMRHLNLEFNSFEGVVDLSGASCVEAAHLADSRYLDAVVLSQMSTGWLDMHGCSFGGRVTALGASVEKALDLRGSEMLLPVLIEANPEVAILNDAVFNREATLQLSGTAVYAARTRFDNRSRISGHNAPVRVIDLENTDVSYLQLDEADLTFCSLSQALNLEQIRFSGGTSFATVPRHFKGTAWYRWRAARKVAWDEVLMHAEIGRPGWADWRESLRSKVVIGARPGFGWALALPEPATTTSIAPRQLSTIYRDLRRAQEQCDEEAESNEFYYSEMTARRRNSRGLKRAVLNMYWMLGGYGVRSSRPLLVTIASAGVLAIGFVQLDLLQDPDMPANTQLGYVAAFRHLLRTATTILGSSEFQPQGFAGLLLDLVGRLLLPALLALAFFGIRSNVRRGRS